MSQNDDVNILHFSKVQHVGNNGCAAIVNFCTFLQVDPVDGQKTTFYRAQESCQILIKEIKLFRILFLNEKGIFSNENLHQRFYYVLDN